jgi:hypothetical protein
MRDSSWMGRSTTAVECRWGGMRIVANRGYVQEAKVRSRGIKKFFAEMSLCRDGEMEKWKEVKFEDCRGLRRGWSRRGFGCLRMRQGRWDEGFVSVISRIRRTMKLSSPSLSGLWWRRLGHACCIVGASAHVEGLHFSSDHHGDCGESVTGNILSATVVYILLHSEIAIQKASPPPCAMLLFGHRRQGFGCV